MKNSSSQVLLAAVGLLTVQGATAGNTESIGTNAKMEALNTASFKSMEGSWLSIPDLCKARVFNADATELTYKKASGNAQSVYAAFEA